VIVMAEPTPLERLERGRWVSEAQTALGVDEVTANRLAFIRWWARYRGEPGAPLALPRQRRRMPRLRLRVLLRERGKGE
jgi:hypothetical protein